MTRIDLDAIVEDLFTNGAGERADRLVLTQDARAGAPARDLGGWGRAAIREKIQAVWEAARRDPH